MSSIFISLFIVIKIIATFAIVLGTWYSPPSRLMFCCAEESFHLAWFLKNFLGRCFPQLHGTNMYRRVVSLGLENLTKYVPRFPWPSETKQILSWFYFPSACCLKKLVRFVSLSFTAQNCREQSLPNMCLVSLGLLDTNKFWAVFTFPQTAFSKTC